MKVCAINFWPGFSFTAGPVGYLLSQAVGAVTAVNDEREADVVLTSVYWKTRPMFPAKTICWNWENVRPNYGLYSYSISSDFDSYGGRNSRVPVWYGELSWPGYARSAPSANSDNHGFEPMVDVDTLLRPRKREDAARASFCCFVAGNPEPHRLLAVEAIAKTGRVDVFGNVAGRPLRSSKYDTLAQYRFNLCFENSIFPGYYTEKPLHAWVGGCIPLYFSDPNFVADFNPRAVVNRIDFTTLDDFARHVAAIDASRDARDELLGQPLLTRRPDIEPAIAFLRDACRRIVESTRQPMVNLRFSLGSGPQAR
ncbi:MAG: hypothetical protein JNL66_24115 [Alphaproteobacteria bacterium]|nr:hypothetical protein [Alphaproteobacteria bacterium]